MMSIKCFYISFFADNSGGGMGSKVNKQLLKAIFNEEVLFIEFDRSMVNITKLKHTLSGFIHGMTRSLMIDILNKIDYYTPDYIFINASQYGILAKKIKVKYPNITIITFFHDIEVLFCWSAIKRLKKPQNFLTLVATYYNEKLITQYSDKIICLNDRENKNLERIYNRTADLLLPSCLIDQFSSIKLIENYIVRKRPKGIFVGSNFFANYFGIKWFVENIASKINADIEIIGLNFESARDELEICDNIKVIGSVESLDTYYYKSDFVIAPIKDGAGMKIKTAEALMYGKTIFGTTEAFVGYEVDFDKVGGLCNTEEEFICKINSYKITNNGFNQYSRNIFIEKYSFEQSLNRLKNLFIK